MAASSDKDSIFALIIGINDYWSDDFIPLQGAVNDARAFYQFLVDPSKECGLQVPASNIVLLENKDATRANILATFKSHLLENPDIPDHGQTSMVLFYAGHGTRLKMPENEGTFDGKVEALCPVDERTKDTTGKYEYVHAIPDYILGWLLSELAETKGPNITVIFDSCYAGGMVRLAGRPRNVSSMSLHVPLDLDSHLWKDKTTTAQSYSIWAPAATSHVLLAACREDETAQEIRYTDTSVHGRFTEELLYQLRRATLTNTTYTDLLDLIPAWSEQHPHCAGARKNRLVFDRKHPETGVRSMPLMARKEPAPQMEPAPQQPSSRENQEILAESFRVAMGSVEGVVPGTEFDAYEGGAFVATLVARSVQMSHSILVEKDNKPIELNALRVSVSDWKSHDMILRVYTPDEFPHTSDLFPTHVPRYEQRRKYVQATSPEKAGIVIRSGGKADDIVIERLTSTILEVQRETRFSLQGNPARLPDVLSGIAHFNYFLKQHNGSAPLQGFSLEMHRLLGEYPARKKDTTVGHHGNMVENDEARWISQGSDKYGFTIRNESAEDLYPYLFYFDPNKYTIAPWYLPPGNNQRPPLRRGGGIVTLGMGGERAFQFRLPEGEASSSGFLKLFVTTEYLDLEWIRQKKSPFDPEFRPVNRMDMIQEEVTEVPKWDALHVLLTMTLDPKSIRTNGDTNGNA
ncbi:caspase domain-containing protein [Mycena rosella]|uniref:Caspase domain-containing protein n=1 Tax=Mycena rosella TaxID=1033263 RepID=A0AAD7DLK0_MYCRO|nr:caspase domain-containing protein [Mycena rosella]